MPKGMAVRKVKMPQILTYEELAEAAEAAVELGITRFKVTGGEPLARLGCPDFIRMLKEIPGVKQVTMTTNGVLLKENLPALLDAGLDAVNISLDTLKKETFRDITGFDELDRVKEGIDAAIDSGIHVKINTVLQKGTNDTEWFDLLMLTKDRPLDLRFIEMMPIGYGKAYASLSNEELQKRIACIFPGTMPDYSIHGNGPAQYMKIPGFQGSVGFISAIHGKFCSSCNRIRLTASGKLKPCLCYADTYDIRSIVRACPGDDPKEREQRIKLIKEVLAKAIKAKPASHCFEKLSKITETREMVEIGG